MSLQVNGALLTDVGRQRSVNEDWCGSFTPDDDQPAVGAVSVWVIADGVSRFGTGREAARFAVEAVLAAGWDQPDQDIERQIREAVTSANRILWNRAHEAGPRRQRASR